MFSLELFTLLTKSWKLTHAQRCSSPVTHSCNGLLNICPELQIFCSSVAPRFQPYSYIIISSSLSRFKVPFLPSSSRSSTTISNFHFSIVGLSCPICNSQSYIQWYFNCVSYLQDIWSCSFNQVPIFTLEHHFFPGAHLASFTFWCNNILSTQLGKKWGKQSV